MTRYILAIDQGTTSTRVLVFDDAGRVAGSASRELKQYYPQPGWVEHDPEEIWQAVRELLPEAVAAAKIDPSSIAGIGITNQRETVVAYECSTGRPLARAIVWQDRRTADFCRERRSDSKWISERTGLVLDPYFSATKIHWLLERHPEWLRQPMRGKVRFGTIDSYLIHQLTATFDDYSCITDVTNASRTLLLNLELGQWDVELLNYFGVPEEMLPRVLPSCADFGTVDGLGKPFDGLPIAGVAGDQQAALFGQAAFGAGESKCTYGTGAFFLLHTGTTPVRSQHRLLTTMAATTDRTPQYALEGSVFVAGAAVQWLRDGLKLLGESSQSEALAEAADAEQPVVFVPGFVGLGAPHWVPEARGAILGLTRQTGPAELARATLEGVAFQVADLLDAASFDAGPVAELRADGGMARNGWFLQRQADVLGLPVVAAAQSEATAQGVAYLAGLRLGVWKNQDELRRLAATGRRFLPQWDDAERRRRRAHWHRAIAAVIAFAGE
jgi:glycerol kinase